MGGSISNSEAPGALSPDSYTGNIRLAIGVVHSFLAIMCLLAKPSFASLQYVEQLLRFHLQIYTNDQTMLHVCWAMNIGLHIKLLNA